MADELGIAVLDLDGNLAPLDAKLRDARTKVMTAVAEMQAELDSLHLNLDVGKIGAARTAAQSAAASSAGSAGGGSPSGGGGLFGVRGADQPGSRNNPLVVVQEAAKFTPLGSMAAGVGESNVADQQSGNSSLATASDMEALRQQVSRLADVSSRAAIPAMAASGNGTALPWPTGVTNNQASSSEAITAAQTAGALRDAADSLLRMQGQMAAAERQRVVASPMSSSSTGGSSTRVTETIYNYDNKSGPAGASSGGSGNGGGKGGPPLAFDAPGFDAGGGGGGNRRTDIYYHRDPSAARTTYNPVRGLRTIGDTGASPFSLGNLFRGDQGRGGALGLPGFGSVGSLGGLGFEHLLLTGAGLTASAGSAVAGAGLLGAAGLSQAVVGGGADALIGHDTIAQAQALYTNVQALNKAIAVYGKGSKQAAAAQYDLNQQWQSLGGGAGKQAIQTLDSNAIAVKKLFDTESTGAREQSAAVLDQIVKLAGSYVPLVTAAAQKNLGIVNQGLKPLFSWLEGPEGKGVFDTLEGQFSKDLPSSIHAFDMGIEDFLRLMQVTSQYTGGLAKDLDNLFSAKAGESTEQYQGEVHKLVDDLHLWVALLKVLAQDAEGIFSADQGTASSIVTEITQMLGKLHDWENSTTGQTKLQNIFYVHKQQIDELLQLLPALVSGYGSFYLTVAPPLVKALTDVAKAVGAIAGAVEKLPGGTAFVGLAIVLGKLGILGPGLKATAAALGLLTAAEAKNVGPAAADAVASGAEDTALTGGAGAAEAGVASRLLGKAAGIGKAGLAVGAGGLYAGYQGAKILSNSNGNALKAIGGGALTGAGTGAAAGAFLAPETLGLSVLVGGAAGGVAGGIAGGVSDLAGLFGNSKTSTLQIKEVGSFANYSTGELKKLITQIKSFDGTSIKVNGVSETKAEILGIADAALKTKQQTQADLQAATNSVNHWTKDTGGSLGDLEDNFQTSMRAIVQYVGTGSTQGKQLMAKNIQDMIAGVTQSMEDGKVSVSSGLKAINNALQIGTKTGAIGFKDSWTDMFDTVTDLYSKHKISTTEYMSEVQSILRTGNAQIVANAGQSAQQQINALKKLQSEGVISAHQLASGTHKIQAQMKGTAQTDMSNFATAVLGQFGAVAGTGGKGMQDLLTTVNAFLKEMGAATLPPLSISTLDAMSIASAAQAANPGQVTPIRAPGGAARGALMQVGQPGEAGHDSVPLNVGGTPIMVAPGEQVAVFNRHQLPIVDQALAAAGYGGLPGLFGSVTTPNYMASGGMVHAPSIGGGGEWGTMTQRALDLVTKAANGFLSKKKKKAAAQSHGHGGGKSGSVNFGGGLSAAAPGTAAARAAIDRAAQQYGVPASVLEEIYGNESSYGTAYGPGEKTYGYFGLTSPGLWNPSMSFQQDADAAASTLAALVREYGSIGTALEHYSGGSYAAGGLVPRFSTGGFAPDGGNLAVSPPVKPGTYAPAIDGVNVDALNDYSSLQALLQPINRLIGPGGSGGAASSLVDQMSSYQTLTQLSDLNFGSDASSYIVTTDAVGNSISPYIDTAAVTKTRGEYSHELSAFLNPAMTDIARAKTDVTKLIPKIREAIENRKKLITKIRDQINVNLKALKALQDQINDLNKQIAAWQKSVADKKQKIQGWQSDISDEKTKVGDWQSNIAGWQQDIKNEQADKHPNKARITGWQADITAAQKQIDGAATQAADWGGKITDGQTQIGYWQQDISDARTKIGSLNANIGQLQGANRSLGGDPTSIGTGGAIGKTQGQISSLQSTDTTLGGYAASVFQPNTTASVYGNDQLTKAQIQSEQAGIGNGPLQAALATAMNSYTQGLGASSSSAASAASDANLQQLNTQLADALFISQQQYKVFASLPPFGGSFKDGGIVPGAWGEPRMILAHGGETVTPPGAGGEVHVHHYTTVLDGAVDASRIQTISRAEIHTHDRKTAKTVKRAMPGRGGGTFAARPYSR